MISQFVHLHPDTRAMVISHEYVVVNPKFKEMGVWICQDCSKFNPMERNECKYCSSERFIVESDQF